MSQKEKKHSLSGIIILLLVLVNALVLKTAFINNNQWYYFLVFTLPLLLVAIYDVKQKKHALLRNYPVIGHLRYFFEAIRPEPGQYFFETDLDGKPFNGRQRSIVHQRAKNEKQTVQKN